MTQKRAICVGCARHAHLHRHVWSQAPPGICHVHRPVQAHHVCACAAQALQEAALPLAYTVMGTVGCSLFAAWMILSIYGRDHLSHNCNVVIQ